MGSETYADEAKCRLRVEFGDSGDAGDAPGRIYTNCPPAGGRKVAGSDAVAPIQQKARSGSGLFANDQCPRPTKCLSLRAVSVYAASGEPIGFDLELRIMAAGGP